MCHITYIVVIFYSTRYQIKHIFAYSDHHSSLCPETSAFLRSQRSYMELDTITVCYAQSSQHLPNHRTEKCDHLTYVMVVKPDL